MEAAIPPRGSFGEHVRKLPAQKHGESLVPIMERFGKKLVLPLEAFIDICFVEAGIGGNGLGHCLYKALSGNDADGASDECLLNFSLFQNGYSYAGSAIAKISGCLRRGGKTANPPPFCQRTGRFANKTANSYRGVHPSMICALFIMQRQYSIGKVKKARLSPDFLIITPVKFFVTS